MNRRKVLGGVLGAGLLPGLGGCIHPIEEDVKPSEAPPRDGELQVRCFQGGYGIDFFETAAREYETTHPGVKIDLKGDPRIWEQLRPQFVAGSPPGLAFPGWGMDHYALIYEDQALALDDHLLTTPYGERAGTWRETFLPEILKLGEYRGQTYLLPYYLTLNGWWYNVNLFDHHGWSPPGTTRELLQLCRKIRAAGIAPLTYQGKYPYYAIQGFWLPWAIGAGGMAAYRAAETLTPGAWNAPPFLQAAELIEELRRNDAFQRGANAMTHTEAQMEFLRGTAAMIPCGTWLESEMKKQLPPGFRMSFFRPPAVDGGQGDPTALQVGVEPWLVPTRGRNPALAVDFFKYLTSRRKAAEFVQAKGSLTAIRGSADGELPATLRAPARCLREARSTWTTRYAQWYKGLEEDTRNQMAALLQGQIGPKEFVDRVEAAATRVRADPNIPKHG